MKRIDTTKWKEFPIANLFEIKRPVARSKSRYEKGNVPFVASGNFNNGVIDFLTPFPSDVIDKGNCITVSPIDGSAFYQKKDFLGRGGAGSSILILYNDNINEYNGLFLAAIIRNSLVKNSYNDQLNSTNIQEEKIKHPSNSNGNPDWGYMETYIKDLKKKSKRNLDYLGKL